jgi:hypothetical protein
VVLCLRPHGCTMAHGSAHFKPSKMTPAQLESFAATEAAPHSLIRSTVDKYQYSPLMACRRPYNGGALLCYHAVVVLFRTCLGPFVQTC